MLASAGLLLMIAVALVIFDELPFAQDEQPAPLPTDHAAKLAFSSQFELPLLITENGVLLAPGDDADWRPMALNASVHDLYAEANGTLWAATAQGLFRYQDNLWTQIVGVRAVNEVEAMHGYTFALGEDAIFRGPESWRELNLKVDGESARDFVMLSDHSHATLFGDIYLTHDMGLSWETLDTPTNTHMIWSDPQGALLAVTDTDFQRWTSREKTWMPLAALPDNQPITMLRNFLDQVYALAGGKLYLLTGNHWQPVPIPKAQQPIRSIERRRLTELWTLEAGGERLWWTRDGVAWQTVTITIAND